MSKLLQSFLCRCLIFRVFVKGPLQKTENNILYFTFLLFLVIKRQGEAEKCGTRNGTCPAEEECQKNDNSFESNYTCVSTKIPEGGSCTIQSGPTCEPELECEHLSGNLHGTCVQLQTEGELCTEEIMVCENWKGCTKHEKSTDVSEFMKCANGLQCLANDPPTKNVKYGDCYRTGNIIYLRCLLDIEFYGTKH